MPRGLRVLETIAGLLSAGLLVLGVVLLASRAFTPSLLGGTGDTRATGPEWGRLLPQLLVGAAGEVLRRFRLRWTVPVRAVVAGAVVVAVPAVLALTWTF